MKVWLRILVILAAFAAFIYSMLPPEVEEESDGVEEEAVETVAEAEPVPEPESSSATESGGVVRELLGGNQIDAGQRAKSQIGEINKAREKQIRELGLGDE